MPFGHCGQLMSAPSTGPLGVGVGVPVGFGVIVGVGWLG